MQWTEEQSQAIYEKGTNILVAAAAGSGKTTVLVERIVNKIINEKIDIDKILVVTFTNLAASQMREKILEDIYKRIEKNPEDNHLKKQLTLLSKANICTIDSFCLEVVKNNFFELDISPNSRIADEVELTILKQETLEEMFEEKYENDDKDFLDLVNIYTTYRGDENLKEVILKIYNYIQSMPYPEKWLIEQVEKFNVNVNEDFSKNQWGNILYNNAKDLVIDSILQLNSLKEKAEENMDLNKFYVVLSEDVRKLKIVNETDSWNDLYYRLQEFFFDRWPTDKKAPEDIVKDLKKKRDFVKKRIDELKKEVVIYNSVTANEDINSVYEVMGMISKEVLEFQKKLREKKKEKNIIDFSDIEHYALSILIKDNVPSNIAIKYQEKFEEIAIDEYQDSNMVQEYILNSVSRGNNIFMVGDVKQSIYKFRQARPELFLEKYNVYKLKKDLQHENGENEKIQLFKNFRSRKEILDLTNLVFQNIMSKDFGEIEYTKEEYLNLGALDYPEKDDLVPELHIIDVEETEEDEITSEPIENILLEAKFVAKKIKSMIEDGYMVCDKDKELRKATYKDFAILLRSTKDTANIFEKEIAQLGMPVFCDTTSEYLNSYEIQIIMNLLKVIDNPTSDIAQISVLRSPIGGFNDNELIRIRMGDKKKAFYYSMRDYILNHDDCIADKIKTFFSKLDLWREKSRKIPLDELIWSIYMETGFYNYVSLMQNGEYRIANLKMLFEKAKQFEKTSFKGVFNFISFIDKLQITSGDMNGAKLIGENENVIRIMSIHKSKGLEFPIVFLCGTGKKFNEMDINKNDILLHNDLGLGPKFIDSELNVKYDTLARKAMAEKIRQEMVAEELRVLYVALTRAKEKIIITGIEKNINKKLEEKAEILSCYNKYGFDKIDKNVLRRYSRFIDFFEIVYIFNQKKINEYMNLTIHKKSEVIRDSLQDEKEEKDWSSVLNNREFQKKIINEISEKINWKYEFMASTKIATKSSVSKIKSMNTDIKENFKKPKFLNDKIDVSPARKGTLIHMVMQRLDVGVEYDYDRIRDIIEKLVARKIITEKEAECIDIDVVYKFTQSKIFSLMKQAKAIYREQPFYINIPASMIYDEKSDDKVLVQGIIDLYFITNDDRIILIDYKTDHVKSENDLIEKYSTQLELYKKAIEENSGKRVDKIYIYSTYLGKEIEL